MMRKDEPAEKFKLVENMGMKMTKIKQITAVIALIFFTASLSSCKSDIKTGLSLSEGSPFPQSTN